MKILFVCLGNICRSPTADGVFRKVIKQAGLDGAVYVDSAGTAGWHIGKSPDGRSSEVALSRGYDLSLLRSRQVSSDDFSEFDLLLAMDSDNYSDLLSLCPNEHRHKVKKFLSYSSILPDGDVPDPYYGGEAGFERVLDLVEEACEALLRDVQGRVC
ncbi:low molecular weight protein-tyrosine-phosphatase [Litoribacillus peritrichatus]|uniref:Low molecular weight protein-tyrosine-phosphatase n=1 Tax=Litoribacillus peritrichatus TaxID=718191 RepID=A0ABP7N1N9_9GAMM